MACSILESISEPVNIFRYSIKTRLTSLSCQYPLQLLISLNSCLKLIFAVSTYSRMWGPSWLIQNVRFFLAVGDL